MKLYFYGDPLHGRFHYGRKRLSDKATLAAYVKQNSTLNESGCWIWKGKPSKEWGYGGWGIEGKTYLAHRVSAYVFLEFDLSSPLLVCHRCDVPLCVNPEHLFIGTTQDNWDDMYRKKRWVHVLGSKTGRSKFTAEQVTSIRKRVAAGETQRSIAREYGVHYRSIFNIVKRRRWRHVP